MGRFFTSFSEAWDYFLGRAEPLEWFLGDFPDDEDFVAEGWLIEPSWQIKRAAFAAVAVVATVVISGGGDVWLAPLVTAIDAAAPKVKTSTASPARPRTAALS